MGMVRTQMAVVASKDARARRAGMIVLALMLGCLLLAACGGDDDERTPAADRPACPAPEGALPGTRAGQAPWPPELRHLGARLDAIGLPRLTQEGQVLDLHVQLSVEVESAAVEVP